MDISLGFGGIPRSAQPPLTASQARILECTYPFAEANADMPYTLFIPSTYDPKKPTPLVVDLHGLNITPLQQILFDGTTDFAERYGFIVLAPMGYSVSGGWGGRVGMPIATAQVKPGTDTRYSASELSEIDAMTALKSIRAKYTIDNDRIYLMGHSLGGGGTYYLGGKYNDIWAALAPISGAGGIADAAAAEKYKSMPMLIMHGQQRLHRRRRDVTPNGDGPASRWRAAHLSGISGEGTTSSGFAEGGEKGESVTVLQNGVEAHEGRVHHAGHDRPCRRHERPR